MNNILKKIAIRCDGASLPEIGTGHIVRMKILTVELIKSKIVNKNNIFFIIRKKNNFKIGYNLIKSFFRIAKSNDNNIKPNSLSEANYLIKNKFELVIFDRLNVSSKIINKLQKNKIKTIIFDNKSIGFNNSDLAINAIFDNVKNYPNVKVGFKYLILASTNFNKKKLFKINNNKIVSIFFGGHDDRNLIYYILPLVKEHLYSYRINIIVPNAQDKDLKKYKDYIFTKLKLEKSNIRIYEKNLDFFKIIASSTFVIISGGLTLFDCIFLKIPSIVIPQYKHQMHSIAKFSKKNLIIKGLDKFRLNRTYTSKKIRLMLKNIVQIRYNLKRFNSIDNKGPLRIINDIKQCIN